MTKEKIKHVIDERLCKCADTLTVKAMEYVRGDDPLHNFNAAAKRKDKHPLDVLDGYLDKHLQSYYDMIADVKAGLYIQQGTIDDKFGDIINYFLLAECLVRQSNEVMETSIAVHR